MVDGRPGEAGAITDPEAATARDRGCVSRCPSTTASSNREWRAADSTARLSVTVGATWTSPDGRHTPQPVLTTIAQDCSASS
jgi:hypothetical protein